MGTRKLKDAARIGGKIVTKRKFQPPHFLTVRSAGDRKDNIIDTSYKIRRMDHVWCDCGCIPAHIPRTIGEGCHS